MAVVALEGIIFEGVAADAVAGILVGDIIESTDHVPQLKAAVGWVSEGVPYYLRLICPAAHYPRLEMEGVGHYLWLAVPAD